MTRIFKGKGRFVLIVTVFLSVLLLESCAPTIKYSYDMKTSFVDQKTYTWAQSSSMRAQDPLLVTNVQILADQILAQKGFTKTSENPDLILSMSYQSEDIGGYESYQLRMLTLNIYKMPSSSGMPAMSMNQGHAMEERDLVWRGTAYGTINTDAAFAELKRAVQGILLNFPPK